MSRDPGRPSKAVREKRIKEERRENRLFLSLVIGIPLSLFVVNPLIGRFIIWACAINNTASPQHLTLMFWLSSVLIATPIFTGTYLLYLPKQGWDPLVLSAIGFAWTLTWLIRLFGSQYTDYSVGDISSAFGLSYLQAGFLQNIAKPVCYLFAVMVVAGFVRACVREAFFTRRHSIPIFCAFAVIGISVFIYGGLQHDYRDLWVMASGRS